MSGIMSATGNAPGICTAADQQPHWRIFCELAGLDAVVDAPRFATKAGRLVNH
jgi:crotonobetainyl-CoA:carnitine CoA-transferase CaiB-like acyl-CoA transferase